MSDSGTNLSDADGQPAQRRVDVSRQEAVSWLLGGLMHESRNALQQISAGAELLGLELGGRPEAMHLIKGIEEGQNRLVRVLEDMRLYATPQEPAPRPIDLASLCRQTWHILATSGRWPAAELHEVDMPAGCPCQGDPALVQIALGRLLEFVVSMAGSPAVIEIVCRDVQLAGRPAVALTVSSRGMQWTADEEAKLFEPFAVRRGRGNGLELPVARRLIELQGGQLRASVGTGRAELAIELPR